MRGSMGRERVAAPGTRPTVGRGLACTHAGRHGPRWGTGPEPRHQQKILDIRHRYGIIDPKLYKLKIQLADTNETLCTWPDGRVRGLQGGYDMRKDGTARLPVRALIGAAALALAVWLLAMAGGSCGL